MENIAKEVANSVEEITHKAATRVSEYMDEAIAQILEVLAAREGWEIDVRDKKNLKFIDEYIKNGGKYKLVRFIIAQGSEHSLLLIDEENKEFVVGRAIKTTFDIDFEKGQYKSVVEFWVLEAPNNDPKVGYKMALNKMKELQRLH